MPATDNRMQIEPAEADDCRAIAAVHVESWQYAYQGMLPAPYLASLSVDDREAMWRRLLERQHGHLLVARTAGQVTGFIAFGPARDEAASLRHAEIWALYVKPAFLTTGTGRALWLAALGQIQAADYERVVLWVIADNARAIRFYERAGFVAEPASKKACELGGTTLWEVRYGRDCASTPSP